MDAVEQLEVILNEQQLAQLLDIGKARLDLPKEIVNVEKRFCISVSKDIVYFGLYSDGKAHAEARMEFVGCFEKPISRLVIPSRNYEVLSYCSGLFRELKDDITIKQFVKILQKHGFKDLGTVSRISTLYS